MSSWTKNWCFWKALNTSFRSLVVIKIKYRVKLIELERIWITCADPLWWMSGIRSSFSRYTISKLELNIDHLINIDLLIPCCLFVFLHQDPSSLLKTFLPSIMYYFIYCGAAGKWEVGYAPDKSSPYLALSSNREKKQTKNANKHAHAAVVSGQPVFSYLLFKKKHSPHS